MSWASSVAPVRQRGRRRHGLDHRPAARRLGQDLQGRGHPRGAAARPQGRPVTAASVADGSAGPPAPASTSRRSGRRPSPRPPSPLADRISDPQVAASQAVTERLFGQVPPVHRPVAQPCRLVDLGLFLCSYPWPSPPSCRSGCGAAPRPATASAASSSWT